MESQRRPLVSRKRQPARVVALNPKAHRRPSNPILEPMVYTHLNGDGVRV
jgi:hypothetical protein